MKRFIFAVLFISLSLGVFSQKSEVWETSYFSDEFGDPTEDSFYFNEGSGTFSNSATRSSPLDVIVIYDEDFIRFHLYKYGFGSNITTDFYNETMTLMFRGDQSEDYSYQITFGRNRESIIYAFNNTQEFRSLKQMFTESNEVRAVIRTTDQETYTFSINTALFPVEE